MATYQRGIIIEVQGLDEIMDFLDQIDVKDAKRILAKANKEGAKYLKAKVKAETPMGPGHFGVHMKKRVSAGAAKRDKPAAIVKYRVGYSHMIMDGTDAHRIRFPDQKREGVPKTAGNIKHPGAKANPIIRRVADQYGDEALDRVAAYLVRAFGLD